MYTGVHDSQVKLPVLVTCGHPCSRRTISLGHLLLQHTRSAHAAIASPDTEQLMWVTLLKHHTRTWLKKHMNIVDATCRQRTEVQATTTSSLKRLYTVVIVNPVTVR
jgi:hypothetical protein